MRKELIGFLLALLMGCGNDESNKRKEASIPSTAGTSAVTASDGEKGDKGDAGPSGPKGDKGDPGSAGAAGTPGGNGASGKDAVPLPVNQWFDPITATYWLITPASAWRSNGCGAGTVWLLPTLAEAEEAVNHGLFIASAAVVGPSTLWTAEAQGIGHIAIGGAGNGTGAFADSTKFGIFCRKGN